MPDRRGMTAATLMLWLTSCATPAPSPSTVSSSQPSATSTPVTGTWTTTASMPKGQHFHDAVLLGDGTVLALGGAGEDGSVQRYDPATESWTTTSPNLADATCCGHIEFLLSDGRLLLIGGLTTGSLSGGTGPPAAVIYDPVMGTWKSTASLPGPRLRYTGALLPNGKVLVAGGTGDTGAGDLGRLASAVLYDPIRGAWEPTGDMTEPRAKAVAVPLFDGTVLVIAGNDGVATTTEIYDTAGGTWIAATSLFGARSGFTATRLANGMVLVAGGAGSTSAALGGAQVYDAETGIWTATGPMITPRQGHSATLLPNGTVLVAGGYGDDILGSAEIYNPATNTWTATADLHEARNEHSATLLGDGTVLVAGGYTAGGDPLTSAELYIPAR